MPKCPVCGKYLKNPNAPNHLNSKFHRDALEKSKENVKEDIYRSTSNEITLEFQEIKRDKTKIDGKKNLESEIEL